MFGDDWKHKAEGKFESKFEVPVMDIWNFKQRSNSNDAESSFGHKIVTINQLRNQMTNQVKEKVF